MKLRAIRLENIRVFAEEQIIHVGDGLTVLMGRNNAGKSTALRAPFLLLSPAQLAGDAFRRHGATEGGVGLVFSLDPGEVEKAAIVPQRLKDLRITDELQRSSSELREVSGLEDVAVNVQVEIRAVYQRGGEARELRLVGRDPRDWIEISPGNRGPEGRRPLARASGQAWFTNVNGDWFGDLARSALVGENNGVLKASRIAYWEHHVLKEATAWISQPLRRVLDTDETKLQPVLTHLRMKHSREFDYIAEAVARALPELGRLDFLDQTPNDYNYRPAFVVQGGSKEVAREVVGTGAWAFLSILTAARAAKATNAQVLFLDEPHLYLHPGLERILLDELLDPDKWGGRPLQLVVSTHSPAFVNYAAEHGVLNVLDWADDARTKAKVTSYRSDVDEERIPDLAYVLPGDLLYADRVVFTEGPSDVVALRLLGRALGLVHSFRYVPLRQTGSVKRHPGTLFRIVALAVGPARSKRSVLVLDGDNRAECEKAWNDPSKRPTNPNEPPPSVYELTTPVWLGDTDFESAFCSQEFLESYFETRNRPADVAREPIREELARLKKAVEEGRADRAENKGDATIERLHQRLLKDDDDATAKEDYLSHLMTHYVKSRDEECSAEVRRQLAALERALLELDKD